MRRLALPHLFGFSLLALALGACQAIAGIEERKLDPSLAVPPDSKQCKDYCSAVLQNCVGDNAVYNDLAGCLGFCAYLEPGDPVEPDPNTVACRAREAGFAKLEPDSHCKAAGPGGNDVCGSDCEAYCQVYPRVCPDDYLYPNEKACLKACSGLTDQDSFDVTRDHDGDSIECRLVHTVSSTTLPGTHCAHAPIPPAQPWCAGKPSGAPTCPEYCKIVMAACDGELTQYESPEQCLAVCEALEIGTNDDQAGNTVGCRRYHAFSSTLAPTTHCFHSGPTGDGHCGQDDASTGDTSNCESYCRLVEAACPDEFAAGPGSAAECMQTCSELPEAKADSKYAVESAESSTGLSCRVLYAARAFEDKTACASALGGDLCD
ncbi:MAG: hypothetical protein EOO73_32780 [Myxococcales bacterium]|nr:MAG: hypothetical protein EOO73_32780 [Myxococcales bacterium]